MLPAGSFLVLLRAVASGFVGVALSIDVRRQDLEVFKTIFKFLPMEIKR